jgi:sterol 24-C-methyltransferase
MALALTADYTDGRQEARVENYTKFWQKDFGKEGEADNQNRVESYTDVVNGIPFHLFLKVSW